jgi:hypothetical protein
VPYNEKTQRQAAIGFVVFLVLTVGMIFIPHWQPHADFDVTGVLWVMQNILRLICFSVFFALAMGAGIVWWRCKRRGSANQ